jgi:hypothetical protein
MVLGKLLVLSEKKKRIINTWHHSMSNDTDQMISKSIEYHKRKHDLLKTAHDGLLFILGLILNY